ncbi:MAG: class I SAM-dependent methyltransferase [Parapedobacter sp.]|nr:MAG: class I SAM-dependent methyltransferase [Parapedobacter sp.]
METTYHRIDGPYDEHYASLYNQIWCENPIWQTEAKLHIKTIADLINPSGKWLDVGCGTGFLLSCFPDADRVGLDFSNAMLEQARKENPNVSFVHQSMSEPNAELERVGFDLVTCTGQPWSYLPTLEAIEDAVANLASWTSKDGKCMLTPIDISDFMPNQLPVIYDLNQLTNNTTHITGIHWILKEMDTVYHHCLSPNLDQWIRWFSKHFRKVEILKWPHEPDFLLIPRRVIVCSQKRDVGDDSAATIVAHPNLSDKKIDERSPLAFLPNKALVGELVRRIGSGELAKAAMRKVRHAIKRS